MHQQQSKSGEEKDGQVYMWQGYTGRVELVSFKTFLSRPVKKVALGGDHSLVLTHDGTLYTCGSNSHGQLGVPSLGRDYSFDPCCVESLTGKGVKAISCGTAHSACTTENGDLYLWGDNQHGQCAVDPDKTVTVISPECVQLLNQELTCSHGVSVSGQCDKAKDVTCGCDHNLVLSKEGRVWVWGSGIGLGLGKSVPMTYRPKTLDCFNDKVVISVIAGDFHNSVLVEEDEEEFRPVNKGEQGGMSRSTSSRSSSSADVSGARIDDVHLSVGTSRASSTTDISPVFHFLPEKCARCKSEAAGLKTDEEIADHVFEENASAKDGAKSVPDDSTPVSDDQDKDVQSAQETSEGDMSKDGLVKGDDKSSNEASVAITDTDHSSKGTGDNSGDVQGTAAADGVDTDIVKPVEENEDKESAEKVNDVKVSIETEVKSDNKTGDVESSDKQSELAKQEETVKTGSPDSADEAGVELRKKKSGIITIVDDADEHPLTASLRSTGSVTSTKSSHAIAFLDETGAREFLARQFQDDDVEHLTLSGRHTKQLQTPQKLASDQALSSSPGDLVLQGFQTVTSLTSQMTSQMSSLTTKAFSNIAAVPGKLIFSSSPGSKGKTSDSVTKSSSETLDYSEISDLELGSNENINLENSVLELNNGMSMSMSSSSEASPNTSRLSLVVSDTDQSPDSTPVWKRMKQKDPRQQSLRTIEAKQENLRKRSLSLQGLGEQRARQHRHCVTMETEIWAWGRNNKGQLGLGDMLDREVPQSVPFMNGKRIIQISCGNQHTLALSSSGQVYSWGLNDWGQLGHGDIAFSPTQIQLTQDCFVWDVGAGSNHSIILMTHANSQGARPEVFYTGKHPCKDLYVPLYKTTKFTSLNFMRKAGWIQSLSTGADNCGCVAKQETEMTMMIFELCQLVRELYRHLHSIIQEYVKRLMMSGFFTTLDIYPYKSLLANIMTAFIQLTKKIGEASTELTRLQKAGDSLLLASFFTHYDDYVADFKKYSRTFEDMVAVGGFEYCTKLGSSTFENLQTFYKDLLRLDKIEEKPNHAEKFRQIMFTPLKALPNFSLKIKEAADVFGNAGKENSLLTGLHLNLEHLIRTSATKTKHAENTKAFWETAPSKISESLRIPSRRLIKESRSSPLSLSGGGRFTTHLFYLFNDIFIHVQGSSYQSYPLETVWIDTPPPESTNHPHTITVTTPEEVFNLYSQTPEIKTEWVVAFNGAINKILASQKCGSRRTSVERVHTPVIRLSAHTFTKHALYKDGLYKGFWLSGKVHGSGMLSWSDGRKYKGKFKNGAQTGYGRFVIPGENNTEEVMEGEWKDGKLHGRGTIRYSSGDLYEGFFKDGLRHGHGVFRKGRFLNSASYVYVGEWLYDKRHGYGVMDDIIKGEKYMGMWQDNDRHGDGVVVTLDGMYFEGNFQTGKLVGFGLMLTDDNTCYEGEFNGITLLQGKGKMTFPNTDNIEGTFNGSWNEGLKISGVFSRGTPITDRKSPSRHAPEQVSRKFGKLTVRPDRKWHEIFYQCWESLKYSGEGEPNTNKAWDQVVSHIVAGKQALKDKGNNMSSRQKLELSTLEQLEKIPTHSLDRLSIEHFQYIVQYLNKSFETTSHPLGRLMVELVDVFRAAYIGIGAHPRLLYHARQEILSYVKRVYAVIRILFPELPQSEGPLHVYPESSRKQGSPIKECMGFIQRQISESETNLEADTPVQVVSACGILQPLLLPRIYPALFDLYALYSERDDDKYWERIQRLNKLADMSLLAYLGVEQTYWCIEESTFKNQHKRLSSIKGTCYSKPVEVLQQLSTAFCPQDKLVVIEKAFVAITATVQEFLQQEPVWCMDELFPIFQFVVIRAQIHHLGAEIHLIEDLMESYLEYGEYGIMFTTLKASYYQIQNEKLPIH